MNNQSPQSSCKAYQMLPINDIWKMKVDKPLLPISSYNEPLIVCIKKIPKEGLNVWESLIWRQPSIKVKNNNFCPF